MTNLYNDENLTKIKEMSNSLFGELGITKLSEIDGVNYKEEYLLLSGSVKDRAVRLQIAEAVDQQPKGVVISSSGNSAIAVVTYAKLAGVDHKVFISPRCSQGKQNRLRDLGANLVISQTPLKDAQLYAQESGYKNLRQSLSSIAPHGYAQIARELTEQINGDYDIYFPVSSATTLIGVGREFKRMMVNHEIDILPSLIMVQTESIHPVVEKYIKPLPQDTSNLGLASALCATNTRFKDEAQRLCEESKGVGLICSENEIRMGHEYLHSINLAVSYEGGLVYSAFKKLDGERHKKAVLLMTGKHYE